MGGILQGSCLCGAIAYELATEPEAFSCCHCSSCRKASGTAFAANATVARAAFRLIRPAETLREFQSSPGKLRAFCGDCGSPVYAYLAVRPEILRLRIGLLDTPFAERPQAHIWVSEMPEWDRICDDIPQFARVAP